MALKLGMDLKKIPTYGRVLIAVVPTIIIVLVVLFVFIFPKNKEIKALEVKIEKQENEIAKNQAKVAKLPELTRENERLKRRLEELKKQLPEEKEVSNLLKKVEDLCLRSGLNITLWRPENRKTHSSGIVYEIPVRVELFGNYHSLGNFFSSLTKLDRIVNISDLQLSDPKPERMFATLKVSFRATTFSAIPEGETVAPEPSRRGRRR